MRNVMRTWIHYPATQCLKKLIPSQRKRMFDEFMKFKEGDVHTATLNISPEASGTMRPQSFIMTWKAPHDALQTAQGSINRSDSTALFEWNSAHPVPEMNGARPLPFDDEAFDWVFCESVIEQIGGPERQYLLLKELMRVARKGIFVTTSNRWHPIEFYTALPLLHWLPTTWWWRALRLLGKGARPFESMLNLLDSKALQQFVNRLPEKPTCSIGHVRLLGLKAYFFLQIKKPATHI